MNIYLDSSACVKLFRIEQHSKDMVALVRSYQNTGAGKVFASSLTALETQRALGREGIARQKSVEFFRAIDQVSLNPQVLERANEMKPFSLKTLDALHLATALVIAAALPVTFVTYDRQLGVAASAAGFEVLAPGL